MSNKKLLRWALSGSVLIASAFLASCGGSGGDGGGDGQTAVEDQSFEAQRAKFATKLLRKGPSPQRYEEVAVPEHIDVVLFPSGDLDLKAWVLRPEADEKLPALLYLHGGYAFGQSDFEDCRTFIDAGFVVMTPMLRGENGNPGNFEMFYGEVDDARAAVRWLAGQSFVDPEQIYVFGHSAGGVISALLALYDDPQPRLTGSSGGLYGESLFLNDPQVPFDVTQKRERELRCLVGNVRFMRKRHIAYVGTEDSWQMAREAGSETAVEPGRLDIKMLAGDHFSILPSSFDLFLKDVRAEIANSRR